MWIALQSCKWSLKCFDRSNRKNLSDVGELHTPPPLERVNHSSEPFDLLFKKSFRITFSVLSPVQGTRAVTE